METRAGKKWLFVLVPILVLLVAVLAVSRLDMGTSMVREKVLGVLSQHTEARLDIERVKGNPLTGYRLENIRLADSGGKEVFTARSLGVSISFSSLLGGSPSLKQMVIEGARVDVEGLMGLLPEQKEVLSLEARIRGFLDGGAVLNSPVRRVEVRESVILTALGDVNVDESVLDLAASDAKGEVRLIFREFPVSGKGKLEWDREGVDLDGLALDTGTGEFKASGTVFPILDVSGEMKDLDLEELARLWPELAKRGFAGKFGTTFKADGAWTEPVLAGLLAFTGGELSGFTLDDAGSEWYYEGAKRSLLMSDVKASLIGIPVSGEMGFVFSQLPPNLDIDLKASDVSLDRVAERFPVLKGAKGTVEEVKVRLTGRTDAIKGNVLVRTGAIEAMGQKLGAGKAELIFNGSSEAQFRADSTWLGRPLVGRGTFPLAAGRSVNMVVEAPGVPLEKLAAIRPEFAPLELQGAAAVKLVFSGVPGKDLGLKGVLASDRLRVKGELFQGTYAEVTARDSDLVIESFKSTWNKAQLGGSGVVKRLTSGNPELALDATVKGLNLESLRSIAPVLAAGDLKGTVSGSAKITGPVSSPKIALTLSSPAISAVGRVKAQEIQSKGELSLQKQGAIPVSGPFQVSAKTLDVTGIEIGAFSLRGSLATDTLKIDEVTASPGGGKLEASGSLALEGKPMQMDLKGTFGDVDIVRMMPLSFRQPLQGKVSGSFSSRGGMDAPELVGSVSSPRLVVSGMALENFKATVAGTPSDLRVEPVTASVGGSPLTGKALIRRDGVSPEVDFGAQGKGLDLASLASGLKKAKELALKGKVDLDMEGMLREGKLDGKGHLSSDFVEVIGLTLTEVNLPVIAQGGKARLEGGAALLYGGKISLDGEMDLARSSWKGSFGVAGTDLLPVTTVLMKGKGNLTGKTDLKFTGNGNTKVASFMGTGNLSVGEGQLGGGKGLDALAKLHGTSTLGYRSLKSNFILDTRGLQLLPGTRALARQKDPIYRHLDVDGPLGFDKSLDLNVSGNVNVQSLNALFGGVQGLLGAAGQSPEAMLQGLLGGLTGGLVTEDFRDVQFKVQGTTEKPRIKDLKIEQKVVPSQDQTPIQGNDIQAAPQKEQPSSPEEVLQKKVLEKIFGD